MRNSPENLLIREEESPEQLTNFDNLKKDIFDFLLPNLDSKMTDYFKEQMIDKKINFKDYFLSNAFGAIMSGEELPDQSSYKYYDNKDGAIEKIINDMIINVQEKAA